MRICLLAIVVTLGAIALPSASGRDACLYKGERISGLNKICYYTCVGGDAAITIAASKLCPLTLE